ncbi:MAG: hypothetical protein ACI8PZ_001994 [Myxococcota bacterium]
MHILIRGSFRPLPGATAKRVAPNVWSVRVPRTDAVQKLVRRPPALDVFDKATFLVGDDESWSAVGERETPGAIWVSVLV